LLEGGGKMKTEVNEELRQVVLVPDGIFKIMVPNHIQKTGII
jgi:hypothetical protein